MFFRMLRRTFVKSPREKILFILIVAFGASLASVMLNLALNVGDKVNQELKSYGSNLQILPKMNRLPSQLDSNNSELTSSRDYLQEQDLLKLKTIFWANNILGFSPYLETPAQTGSGQQVKLVGTWFKKQLKLTDGTTFTTGTSEMKSWWKVDGSWPQDSADSKEVLVGKQAADKLGLHPGDMLTLQVKTPKGTEPTTFRVAGTVQTGGQEDEQILAPLSLVQNLLSLQGKIGKAEVSALTVPDNELAGKVGTDPSSLRESDFDKWYCTAYTGAIAYQIKESIPDAQVKPILQISRSEGIILNKIELMMLIISVVAVFGSALGISTLMSNKVQERSKEIALMKAVGATDSAVASLFMGEALISGVIGGVLGYGIGIVLAQMVGQSVFHTVLTVKLLGLPLILLLSCAIMAMGSYPAVRSIMKLEPIQALQGR